MITYRNISMIILMAGCNHWVSKPGRMWALNQMYDGPFRKKLFGYNYAIPYINTKLFGKDIFFK